MSTFTRERQQTIIPTTCHRLSHPCSTRKFIPETPTRPSILTLHVPQPLIYQNLTPLATPKSKNQPHDNSPSRPTNRPSSLLEPQSFSFHLLSPQLAISDRPADPPTHLQRQQTTTNQLLFISPAYTIHGLSPKQIYLRPSIVPRACKSWVVRYKVGTMF
ncbi:hypothetical protein EAF00_009075 [Botryotinia globosa]|nr:hypothetical protein EAF00_009075 [Botryotinia globosa]